LFLYREGLAVRNGKVRAACGVSFMLRFVAGIVAGLVLGVAVSAYAARIIGSGNLNGWTVTWDDKDICSDPYVDMVVQRIACD
jgi:hypothetical protein